MLGHRAGLGARSRQDVGHYLRRRLTQINFNLNCLLVEVVSDPLHKPDL